MKKNNFDVVLQYASSVVGGSKIACVETKEACQRFLDDLDNPLYEFKKNKADLVVQIIENTFVHIKGDSYKGKPFLLEPWEKFICYNLAGFYLKGTNERRFKEAFIYIPRKNGKTPLAAAIAWALSFLDRAGGSNLYIVGSALKQAMETFNIIHRNLIMTGNVADFRILNNNSEHSISKIFYDDEEQETGSIRIEALASNAEHADGLNGNIIILDELHAYKNANQYFVYKQATKAYVNKLLIGITTAGRKMNSFCYQRLSYCQKILKKEFADEQYFIFICKADDPDDYTNPVEHEKANPNYGVTIRASDIMADALQAQNDISSRNEFLNKSLNIYTNVANAYFAIDEWILSDEEVALKFGWTGKTQKELIEILSKLPIAWYGSADLSVQFDLTASGLFGEYQGVKIAITHGFIPVLQAQIKADEDNIPFFWWQEQGWLTLCNGEVINYEDVVNWFVEMRGMGFKIKTVAFDKYNSRDFVASMEKKKFKMQNSDQQYWKKSEAFRDIEREVKKKNFYYLCNKAYEYCVNNVKAFEDSNERMQFEKVAAGQRIDLFDVSVIGCKEQIINKEKAAKAKNWF